MIKAICIFVSLTLSVLVVGVSAISRHIPTVFDPDSSLQSIDTIPPTAPTLKLMGIWRGMGNVRLNDSLISRTPGASIGTVDFIVTGSNDDCTLPDSLGYRFFFVNGQLPKMFVIPTKAYYAFISKQGKDIWITWKDGYSWVQDPFEFRICVAAIDDAGNESPRSNIVVVADDGNQEERYRIHKERLEKTLREMEKHNRENQ